MLEEEGVHPAPISIVARGKQRAMSMPTITVFLPRSLQECLARDSSADLFVGWYLTSGTESLNVSIVAAGVLSAKQAKWAGLQVALDRVDGPCLVGRCRSQSEKAESTTSESIRPIKRGKVWVEVDVQNRRTGSYALPVITSIHAPIASSSSTQCAINVVLYTVPRADRMRYMSLEPIVLPKASSAGVLDKVSEMDVRARKDRRIERLEELTRLDPLRHAELAYDYSPGDAPGEGFRKAITLLNQCSYLNDTIASHSSRSANGKHGRPASRFLAAFSSLGWLGVQVIQSARSVLKMKVSAFSLTDVSATARQLDLRLGQCMIWPSLGRHLRTQRRKEQSPVSNLAPRYIALYNGVWLVLNDVILGQAVGLQICEKHHIIASLLSRWLRFVLVDVLIHSLTWLDNWPAGLKLNTQLSHFLCDMFRGLTTLWNDAFVSRLLANDDQLLCALVYSLGLGSRLMGLTMLLSMTVDALRLVTLHWTLFYRIQQAIFSFFASGIVSLFHLFRGKKRNPLRKNRTDRATYELDQLLLGTIFFTLLLFLFLTVAVYYLHFSLLRLSLVCTITVLQTGLAVLNHLPLFALMLRLKEPDRLPSGVQLQLCPTTSTTGRNPLNCTYFELHNTPLGLKGIFRGYDDHIQAIRNLPRLFWSLLLGRKY